MWLTALKYAPWIAVALLIGFLYLRGNHYEAKLVALQLQDERQHVADLTALTTFQEKVAKETVERDRITGESYAGKDKAILDIAGERDASIAELGRVRRAARQASAGSSVPSVPDASASASGSAAASPDVPERDAELFRLAAVAEGVRDSAERCQRWVSEQAGVRQ